LRINFLIELYNVIRLRYVRGVLFFSLLDMKTLRQAYEEKLTMRKIIAALQTSVDGFIKGPNGELNSAMVEDEETWRYRDETLSFVDTFILGRRMYPAYEWYWLALLANPTGTKNENAYRATSIRYPILAFPRPSTRWHGRRHGSFWI
jgi:hypothetical protein